MGSGISDEIAAQMIMDVRGRRALLGDEDTLRLYMRALKYQYFRSISHAAEAGAAVPSAKTEGQIAADQEFRRLYQECCLRAYSILQDSYDEWADGKKSAADVSSADLEKMLCSGIPTTKSGNLEKSSAGMLGRAFNNYRLSRQRMESLLKGKTEVERTDLITLEFFLLATDDKYEDPVIRFEDFRRIMNQILEHCRMYKLYIVNPYETFILMCTLTEYPLGSYNDIWEYSYEAQQS